MAAAALQAGQVSKQEAIKEAVSARRSLKNLRDKVAERAGRAMDVGLTLGGAAAAGYVDAKFPGMWMNVDKTLWIGGGLVLLGLSGLAGAKASDPLMNLGNGMLSAWLYNLVKAKV